jgi:hypothetical protein
VQAHVDKVMEHHIDDCPRAVGLRLRSVGIGHGNLQERAPASNDRDAAPDVSF